MKTTIIRIVAQTTGELASPPLATGGERLTVLYLYPVVLLLAKKLVA